MCAGCVEPPGPSWSRRSFIRSGAAVTAAVAVERFTSLRASAAGSAKSIRLICRDAWGAKPPSGEFTRHNIVRCTVHHSAVLLSDNRDAPARFRSHQQSHQERGWPDIAYHLLIDRHGHVYDGRPITAVGDTATDYDPTGHLLVMCEGNFSEQRISRDQATALVDILAWACRRFEVSPRRIKGHRDFVATACPGADLYARIADGAIRRRVARRLTDGGVTMNRICGDEGRRLVRRIEEGRDR